MDLLGIVWLIVGLLQDGIHKCGGQMQTDAMGRWGFSSDSCFVLHEKTPSSLDDTVLKGSTRSWPVSYSDLILFLLNWYSTRCMLETRHDIRRTLGADAIRGDGEQSKVGIIKYSI